MARQRTGSWVPYNHRIHRSSLCLTCGGSGGTTSPASRCPAWQGRAPVGDALGVAERERERAEEKGGRCATVPGHAPVLTCLKGVE